MCKLIMCMDNRPDFVDEKHSVYHTREVVRGRKFDLIER